MRLLSRYVLLLCMALVSGYSSTYAGLEAHFNHNGLLQVSGTQVQNTIAIHHAVRYAHVQCKVERKRDRIVLSEDEDETNENDSFKKQIDHSAYFNPLSSAAHSYCCRYLKSRLLSCNYNSFLSPGRYITFRVMRV